jgi:hypothetical protein
MASQVSPGVVIRERDLSNAVVVGDVAITAAFASTFAKGPVGVITNINSERELIDTFGGPAETNASDWLVASEYLQYGGRLAVVRATTGVLNATASGSGVLIKNKDDFDGGVTSEVFAARYAGTEGNFYRVVVIDRGADEIATVVGHGLTAGATYNDGTNDHEVYAVLGVDTIAIINTDGVKASANGVTTVPWYSNTEIASTGLKLSAVGPRPGTSAFASENYLNWDEMHVAIIDERTNTIVERFTYVSKLSDAVTPEGASNYWRDVVNFESAYLYSASEVVTSLQATGNAWGGTAASYAATSSAPEYMKLQLPTGSNGAFDGTLLAGGTDDYAYTAGEIQTAYNEFLDTEASEIDFVLMGGSMASEADTKTKAGAVIGVATSRTDCMAFVSPHVGNQIAASGGSLSSVQQRENTIAFFDTLPSTSFAVFDSGIKYTYDRFADKYRYIGCNGDIAGLCVRTSNAVDDWISPAGLNRGGLRNVVKLAYNPNKADRDELYQSRINPVVSFPGSGPVLFGDKTALASPSAFDRINVRRLFLNIEKRAGELGKQVLFEQNDSITRGGFNSAITSYLAEVQARRGLTDYLVVCDESNNTPAVIDRNEFVAELYLKPTRSINYVTVTVTATRTGVEFSEVVGR